MMRHMEYMRKKSKEEQANMQSDNLDMVNSPAHYNEAGIETIDIIQSVTKDEFEAYIKGNILKYLSSYRYKQNAV